MKVEVSTLNEEVYRRLREWITTGHLAPGLKVSMRALGEVLGVSTMPVRDALRRLEAEGLVVFDRRAVRVVELSAQDISQAFAIRLRLEQLTAEWAVERADEHDLAELRSVLDLMVDPHLDPTAWRTLNRRFHERLTACARSRHLDELLRNVGDRIEASMTVYASTVDDFAEAHRQHERMLTALAARDLPALLAETAWHLEHTARTVTEALPASGATAPAPPGLPAAPTASERTDSTESRRAT